jgi:hypothetical protein
MTMISLVSLFAVQEMAALSFTSVADAKTCACPPHLPPWPFFADHHRPHLPLASTEGEESYSLAPEDVVATATCVYPFESTNEVELNLQARPL